MVTPRFVGRLTQPPRSSEPSVATAMDDAFPCACGFGRSCFAIASVRKVGEIDRFGGEVDEPSPRLPLQARLVVGAAWSAVRVTVPVMCESPSDHDQPCGELSGAVRPEQPEPAQVVVPQLLEGERVRIHDGVVVAMDGANRVQDDAAVGCDELLPRAEASGVGGGVEDGPKLGRCVG